MAECQVLLTRLLVEVSRESRSRCSFMLAVPFAGCLGAASPTTADRGS